MTGNEILALLPLLILAAVSVICLVAIAVRRHHGLVAGLTVAGCAAALVSLVFVWGACPIRVGSLFLVDRYGVVYLGLILGAALGIAAISRRYLAARDINREEYYILLATAALGAGVMVVSSHFAGLFLGLEILGIALYALIGYDHESEPSLEASFKYLILAAAASAFILFGAALIYCRTGSLELSRLLEDLRHPWSVAGLCLMVVGIGFKLSVVPFHMWTPDVYQGSPAPVAAFVATVSKGAMFAVLARWFALVTPESALGLWRAFACIAVASMFVGNLLAVRQDDVKRLLAYSSIAHLGYLLVAFLSGGDAALKAGIYYLAAYFATTVAAFGVITALSGPDREASAIGDYRGLLWRRPAAAATFAVALLSLAGIPLTAGFLGKFWVVLAGVGTERWLLVIALAVNSAIGIYYYLRVIVAMYVTEEPARAGEPAMPSGAPWAWADRAVLAAAVLVILWLGVYPGGFLGILDEAAKAVGR